jgi:hypothetical protein
MSHDNAYPPQADDYLANSIWPKKAIKINK